MNIHVHGNGLVITEALRAYADRKIRHLERYVSDPSALEAHVRLSVEHTRHVAEVTFVLHGIVFRAEERTEDMYASIDRVEEKLLHQLEKYKTRLNRRFRQAGKPLLRELNLSTPIESFREENTEDNLAARIQRRKTLFLGTMDVEEAVLQMDLLGHDFFLFRNADVKDVAVHVLYRRKNGNLGLIELQTQ